MTSQIPLLSPEAVKKFKSPYHPPFSKGERSKEEVEVCSLTIRKRFSSIANSPLWKRGARGDFWEFALGLIIFSQLPRFQRGMIKGETKRGSMAKWNAGCAEFYSHIRSGQIGHRRGVLMTSSERSGAQNGRSVEETYDYFSSMMSPNLRINLEGIQEILNQEAQRLPTAVRRKPAEFVREQFLDELEKEGFTKKFR
jgi:hypothetical protein